MDKNNIEEAKKLINKSAFKKAEDILLLIRKERKTSEVCYLLGYIHHVNLSSDFFADDKEKFKGIKESAKRFLGESIDLENPVEDAFWRLADIEENKNHAIRILKKGLEYFSNSESLYISLINISEKQDILKIYKEIIDKNIISDKIYLKLSDFFFKQKNFIETIALIEKVKIKNKDEDQLLSLIKAFCLYELSENKKAEEIFQKLINDDISQKLNYSEYIGISLCFYKDNKTNEGVKLIKELPVNFEENYTWIPDFWGFNFEQYFENFLDQSIILLKEKTEFKDAYAKLRGIRAVSRLQSEGTNKKTISELIFARNNDIQDKEKFDTALVDAYRYANQIPEAFKHDLNNVIKYSNYESQAEFIFYDISNEDLKRIVGILLEKLNSVNSWQRDNFKEVARNIIPILTNNNDYQNIIKISSYFSDDTLEKINVLFEIAYAYNKIKDTVSAKRFYEKIWIKEQKESAVANNLGLLYENDDDRDYAKLLFEKSLELNPNNEQAKQNLQRVAKSLEDEVKDIKKWEKEQEKVLENIKNENIYICERISYLIDSENDQHYIIASYGQLSGILKATPGKVQELIKSFLQKNYILKVKNHNIDTPSNVYRINNSIRDFILKQKERIEENKPLSLIGEKINLDSFDALGFDKSLLQKIDLKVVDNNLRQILKRDLQENVFALITQSYKTSLVLSGSIIESLILNKVLITGIVKHLPKLNAKKNKKVIEMDLSELLFVVDENKIIEIQLYHFSQALKHYRNFIHPAVEIRKGKIRKISEQDAKLAWEIVKKVIFEI